MVVGIQFKVGVDFRHKNCNESHRCGVEKFEKSSSCSSVALALLLV